ncbi:corrinoid protein [Oscillospiraceae bacterium NSJ-64]|uniref:Corrinoid protein n=1 Tax=Youxingia wuxianensis TaxID=2763678 RepID=A0A926EL04_9FIRM|nr:corrinoid protein [Youxingia wuxianensis]MBC8584531.1 corrinoid protein [Youxingia wuxianensis]
MGIVAVLEELSLLVQRGRAPAVKDKVALAIEEGISPKQILEEGLLEGMNVIGEKFKINKVFVPEVLLAARALDAGIAALKPLLVDAGVEEKGTVVIGTVKGDLHDIGKNLVKLMLEGKGLKVIDLGVDVPAEKYVAAAQENEASIICCSALLTTTMNEMKRVVELVKTSSLNGKVKVMIGGAPVTQNFCETIGADRYTPDAATAAQVALEYCS